MDALKPTLDGQIKTEEGGPEFKLDEASWIEGGKVWILELRPADSPLSGRDLEETREPRNAEIVGLKYSSVQSKQSREMGIPAIQEYQHESGEIMSSTPVHLQAKETFIGNGEAFSQRLKLTTHQRSQCEKLLHCDQCGKAFQYPSGLARHQHVHLRQKAKRTHTPSKAGSPSSLKPTPRALQSMFTKSRKVLSQNSNVTTNRSNRRRRWRFCDHCGKAFRYPSDLARHQEVHTRQKAAKRGQSQSEVENPRLLESTVWALQMENTFTKSSKAFHQKSKAMTGQNTHLRKWHCCDQCGKAFLYPSDLARHQGVHARQKAAKWAQSPSEADNPSPLDLPLLAATQVENTSINSSKVLCQNSKVTANQSRRRRKRLFCDQCGKAFWYPAVLARHQHVHSEQRAAKQGQSQSEAGSPSSSQTLAKSSKATTQQSTHHRRQLLCDQCGKAFLYPSDLARHQGVHARQKAAKWAQSSSEADNPSPLDLPPLATTQVENTSINSSKVLCQNSKVTANQSRRRRRKRRFCDQCGDAFCYPPDLARLQCMHSRQKAAKWAQSPSEADNRSPLELPSLITLLENVSINSSKALSRNSKVMANQSSRRRERCSCDQCGKAFWYPAVLARHQRVHSEQRAAKQGQSQSEAGSPSSSQTLAKSSKATTQQSTHHGRQLLCEQCGKAFRYPSDLARHQGVHSRQKWILSQSEADSPTCLEPSPVEPQVESPFTHSSKELHQDSKLTTDQSSRCSKLPFCDQCGKAFRGPSDLARHQGVHSRRKAAVPLPKVLQREAVSPSSARMTDRNTHIKKPYLCDQCGEGFWWCSELTQHEYTHFQDRPYDCGICGHQFRRHVQLVKHQKWHEDSQGGEEGGEMFRNTGSDNGIGEYMLRELLQDLPPKRTGELCEPFVSPEACKRGAGDAGAKDTSALLPANSIWEIGISGQPYLMPLPPASECGCCETKGEGGSSAWPTKLSLLQAEVTSSTTLVPAVSFCELLSTMPTVPALSPGAHGHIASTPKEKTSTASTAVDHVAWPPQAVSPDPEWLPSLKRRRQSQKQASSSVQGAKPHSCPICSKCFRVAGYLKRHLNIHRLGKPYSCVFCGKRFGRDSYLAKHYRRIHREVPKEKTSTASITTDHVARPPRTVSPDPEWLPSLKRCRQPQKQARSSVQGAKPHSCPICSKSFSVSEYLKKHLNIHRLGKPYSCAFCGKRFGQLSYLAKHYRRIHGKVGAHLPMTQQLLVSTL